MKLRSRFAAFVGRICAFTLTHIFHRNASQLPGRVALSLAGPTILSDLCAQLNKGAIMVCGTNGKTTTNNVLAAALKESGASVACNYAGANMLSGIVSALLPLARSGSSTDWAVLEVDELSSAHTLPQIKPRYFVLLNLFRDQLDRAGEIDKIQEVIATALKRTPDTTLVVCGDDPLCMGIVERLSAHQCESVKTASKELASSVVAFGIGEETGVPADRVPEARYCQVCGAELNYIYRHYAQLGNYQCPNSDFARPALNFSAQDVVLDKGGVDFKVSASTDTSMDTALSTSTSGDTGLSTGTSVDTSFSTSTSADTVSSTITITTSTSAHPNAKANSKVTKRAPQQSLHVPFGGLYMVYNMLAVYAVTALIGIPVKDFQRAVTTFHPDNGRLQNFNLSGQDVVLNLAKNPTGFNQNISLMLADPRPKHVFFVVNDNFNDGKDISWIWDVDFERLTAQKDLTIFVGGTRANDLAVRMKYAGFGSVPIYLTAAEALTGMKDASSEAALTEMGDASPENSDELARQPLYILTNYSALWPIKAQLEKMQKYRHKCEHNDQPQRVQQHQHQHKHKHKHPLEHQHKHKHKHPFEHEHKHEHKHDQKHGHPLEHEHKHHQHHEEA